MSEEVQGIGKKKERADSLNMDYIRGGEKKKGKEQEETRRKGEIGGDF